MSRIWSALIAFALWVSPANAEPQRLITLGGDITEIVFALGAGGQIVGTDTTSVYPAQTAQIPKLGYVRSLGAEGIVALKPDLVLASADAGPDAVLAKVKAAGIEVLRLEKAFDETGIIKKINAISEALNLQSEGAALVTSVTAGMSKLGTDRSGQSPTVLFVLSMTGQSVMAAGRDTAAHAAIELAGGRNLFAGFEGYKPVSPEALLAAPPDAIVVMRNTVSRMGGLTPITSHPALSFSPAVRDGKVMVIDGIALLGFGPRTPAELQTLSEAIARP